MSLFRVLSGPSSFTGRPWRLHEAGAQCPQDACSIVERFLASRGLLDPTSIQKHLDSSLADMADPALLPDASLGALRILKAIEGHEKITVYGDYDVDGVTSASLLYLALASLFGTEVDVYIPHRLKEGYGLNRSAIEKIHHRGTSLLITVDNGSSAVDEAAFANELGMDLIIIDHHQVADPEPLAMAHLNPHRKDSKYPYRGLAAVGIAFMLLVELRRCARRQSKVRVLNDRIDQFLDLVALGTVADVAPLTDINRALVRYGLQQIKRGPRVGVRALCEVCGVDFSNINEGDLGFRLGPRVNAAGRLESARDGFVLLTEEHEPQAFRLARLVDEQNSQRRLIQERIEQEALLQAEGIMERETPQILILHGKDWHPGIVGIVASRVVEQFNLPTFCLALDGNVWKGSGRSTPSVNLKALLDLCSEHLLRYGGHVAAAGVTLNLEALDGFCQRANEVIGAVTDSNAPPQHYLDIDLALDVQTLNFELMEQFFRAGPFGHENPQPRILLQGVLMSLRTLKEKHLKLTNFVGAQPYVEGIGWNMGGFSASPQQGIDLVCTPRVESWRGRRKINLTVLDLRPSRKEQVYA